MEKATLTNDTNHVNDFFNYLQYEKLYTKDTIKNYSIDLKQYIDFSNIKKTKVSECKKEDILHCQ